MARIDLHTHTTASDGTDTPAQLIANAVAAGLTAVAITDHDTERGWADATAAALEEGIALVRGMEITTQDTSTQPNGAPISVHLLSYLHDPGNPDLAAVLAETQTRRDARLHAMFERVAEDYPITWEDVLVHAAGKTVGRPHLADTLVDAGLVTDREEAFDTILARGGKYYVRADMPDTTELIALVRAAGGVPVLAHPRSPQRAGNLSAQRIAVMAKAGLAGIEVNHREHDTDSRAWLQAVADDLGLLTTGSSDYHGFGKLNRLGENTTSEAVYRRIVEAGFLPVIGGAH